LPYKDNKLLINNNLLLKDNLMKIWNN